MVSQVTHGAKEAVSRALPADHPTATIYLDESGLVKTDRFFGIGCIKAGNGAALSRMLWKSRQRLEFFDEIHWAHFDKAHSLHGPAFELGAGAIDAFFEHDDLSFCCIVADRQNGDLMRSYGSGWEAYEGFAVRALNSSLGGDEIVSVMADHVDTPAHVRFEESVASRVNATQERLAVTSVSRLHSHAVDGLQLVDLMLGAAMFDFRQGAVREDERSEGQKAELSRRLLDHCGVASFRPSGKEIPGKLRVEMRRRKRTRRRRRGGDPS